VLIKSILITIYTVDQKNLIMV